MTDQEIREKFQLLSNQRNQQKREVCRNCFQTGKRGTIYGIQYFYEGTDRWDSQIPSKGKAAEKGCIGCPWYDIARWRKELNNIIAEGTKNNLHCVLNCTFQNLFIFVPSYAIIICAFQIIGGTHIDKNSW